MPRSSREDERKRLGREIALERARGYTWRTVADHHGISARYAQQLLRAFREGPESSVEPVTCTEAMAEEIELHNQLIEDYTEFIETTTNPSVKLGAMKQRLHAVETRRKLLQATGYLPYELAFAQNQDFALWLHDAIRETIHRARLKADELHILEPLDQLLVKLEDGKAWRLSQRYPRIQSVLEAKQAQRETVEEQRGIGHAGSDTHAPGSERRLEDDE